MHPAHWKIYVRNLGAAAPLSRRPRKVIQFRVRPLLINTDIVVFGGPGVVASYDTDMDEVLGEIVWPGTEASEWFRHPEPGKKLDLSQWFFDGRVVNQGLGIFAYE